MFYYSPQRCVVTKSFALLRDNWPASKQGIYNNLSYTHTLIKNAWLWSLRGLKRRSDLWDPDRLLATETWEMRSKRWGAFVWSSQLLYYSLGESVWKCNGGRRNFIHHSSAPQMDRTVWMLDKEVAAQTGCSCSPGFYCACVGTLFWWPRWCLLSQLCGHRRQRGSIVGPKPEWFGQAAV